MQKWAWHSRVVLKEEEANRQERDGRGGSWEGSMVLFLLLIGLQVVPLVVLMSSVCVAMPTGYSTCYLCEGMCQSL